MSTTTLTSLAILKVNIDHGRDYLDYLRPLILHVLVKKNPDHITDQIVKEYIYDEFGLVIPEQTIHVVLKRISKSCGQIKKTHGVYKIVDTLPEPDLTMKLNEARTHIQAIVTDLIEFSKKIQEFPSSRHAEIAICAFLEKFDVSCLRAYLRGTTIPNLEGKHNSSIIIVSKYAIYLQKANPERFNSFMIMVQGHMLANALLCPDLQHISGTYSGVIFYLDTPLLIRRMGLEGIVKQKAVKELIELLQKLEGEVCTFSHSREELYNVLRGAAEYLDAPNGRGAIITEARRQGTTKSDLLLLAERIDSELDDADIGIRSTPRYISDFQIDETAFEDVLDDEVFYHNPRAKQYDINSVRSIYVLRGKKQPLSLEKSRAILVTNNSAFARAAWNYGNEHELSHNVSSVITDFSLANVAWLKAPMGSTSIPITEILAFSYAALQPTRQILDKYMHELDKLEESKRITVQDLQLLRSSVLAQDELVHLTLNVDSALTQETVSEILQRVTKEITHESDRELEKERIAHNKTMEYLNNERDKNRKIQENLYWKCRRRSQILARITSSTVAFFVLVGLLTTYLKLDHPISSIGITILVVISILNLLFGTTIKKIHTHIEDRILTWFIKHEASSTSIDLSDWKK